MSSADQARKFHFIREIASGGFGSVYLARVMHSDGFARLAAVKLLHPKWSENQEISSRMRDEARLLGLLHHKNIVEVYDLTRIAGRVAVIMEYLEAVDLKLIIGAYLERSSGRRSPEYPPIRAVLEVHAAVASALDAAYDRPPYAGEKPLRVIHRDIKPSNIMIDTAGAVKVLDFGVARADFDEREARTQEMAFGSLDYMPPERLFFEPDTPTSDIYSLGVTLYEALTLDKFGRAKLEPADHQRHLDAKWAELEKQRQLGPEAAGLRDLLAGMLAFESADRIGAAEVGNRMRALARQFSDADVGEWAEQTVGPLFRDLPDRPRTRDSLVDMVVPEDPRGLAAVTIPPESVTTPLTATPRPAGAVTGPPSEHRSLVTDPGTSGPTFPPGRTPLPVRTPGPASRTATPTVRASTDAGRPGIGVGGYVALAGGAVVLFAGLIAMVIAVAAAMSEGFGAATAAPVNPSGQHP